jgi:hypothetical protein
MCWTAMTAMMWACTGGAVIEAPDTQAPSEVDIEYLGEAELPELSLSQHRGLYEQPFDLVIESSSGELLLTFDGSDPRDSGTVTVEASPLTLRIDPRDELGGHTAPAVVLRASARNDQGLVSVPQTHTYLFPGMAAELSPHDERPGEAWPRPYETNSEQGAQAIDYGLDPSVTEDPDYAALIEPALRALPTLSLVLPLEHLFDEDEGIYMNALEHGREWERPTSIELLDPSGGAETFQADAGLRIRGGWSRHSNCPKHALRLHFRSEYGSESLDYALFGDEGADRFETLDLRTAQNYSWSFKTTAGQENTFLRDVFSRDAQRDMGAPYTRSRFYHLYINGVYWGLYQSQERAEASYASTYLGGDKDAWDVVKVNGDDPRGRVIEATDGDLDTWREIWDLIEQGMDEPERFEQVEALVDLANLADYMLVIFYAGNFDAPTGAFTNNQGANNFFALFNREDPGPGFRFFAHDSEHSLHPLAWSPGVGLTEDRVNLGTRTDSYRMNVNDFEDFHPQWLHHRLTDSADYRELFDERVRLHLLDEGALSTQANRARIEVRAAEIELAIVAESARWGDSKVSQARTRDDDWQPAVDRLLQDWVPYRNAIVLEQLEQAGLYTP